MRSWTLVGTTWGPVVTDGDELPVGELRDVVHVTDHDIEQRWRLLGTRCGPVVIFGAELVTGRSVSASVGDLFTVN